MGARPDVCPPPRRKKDRRCTPLGAPRVNMRMPSQLLLSVERAVPELGALQLQMSGCFRWVWDGVHPRGYLKPHPLPRDQSFPCPGTQ